MTKKIFSTALRTLNLLSAARDVAQAVATATVRHYETLNDLPWGTAAAIAVLPLEHAHEYLDTAALEAYDAAYDAHQVKQAEVREDCRLSVVLLGRALEAAVPAGTASARLGARLSRAVTRDWQLEAHVKRARTRVIARAMAQEQLYWAAPEWLPSPSPWKASYVRKADVTPPMPPPPTVATFVWPERRPNESSVSYCRRIRETLDAMGARGNFATKQSTTEDDVEDAVEEPAEHYDREVRSLVDARRRERLN